MRSKARWPDISKMCERREPACLGVVWHYMRKIVIGILVMFCIQAHALQDLLLPQARHIVGVVVDPEGKPVVDAHVDHSNDRQVHRTDSQGRFGLDTRAPILVVRKAGFRSEMVRTRDAIEARVNLRKLSNNRFPTCSNTGRYDGIDGWAAVFQFPRTSGVKVGRQGKDIDYGIRSYYVHTKQGPRGIRHGSGPLWSFGTPSEDDVWRSAKYEEVVYDLGGGLTIIDARGQFAQR
jgi:hypothetical protein